MTSTRSRHSCSAEPRLESPSPGRQLVVEPLHLRLERVDRHARAGALHGGTLAHRRQHVVERLRLRLQLRDAVGRERLLGRERRAATASAARVLGDDVADAPEWPSRRSTRDRGARRRSARRKPASRARVASCLRGESRCTSAQPSRARLGRRQRRVASRRLRVLDTGMHGVPTPSRCSRSRRRTCARASCDLEKLAVAPNSAPISACV